MHIKIQSETLPDLFIKKLKLRWSSFTLILTFFLIVILFSTVLADGMPLSSLNWNFWRDALQSPVIFIYVLCIYPIIKKIGNQTLESVIPLLFLEREEQHQFVVKYLTPRRTLESLSIVFGVLVAILLLQPWNSHPQFFNIYLYVVQILMFSIIALLIYYSLVNTRLIIIINRSVNLDVFNTQVLAPFARWSLSISLSFIGGIIISIIFQNVDNLMKWQVIAIYISLVTTAALVFFMSLWSAHVAIVRTKEKELIFIRQKMVDLYRKYKDNSAINDKNNTVAQNEITTLGIYEKQIHDIKEWPYNTGMFGRLVASLVSPGVVYMIKILWDVFLGS